MVIVPLFCDFDRDRVAAINGKVAIVLPYSGAILSDRTPDTT